MAYKTRFKKEKKCPACDVRFYGYKNKKFCCPKHGRIYWKHGHVLNTPKALKIYEANWKRSQELSIKEKER